MQRSNSTPGRNPAASPPLLGLFPSRWDQTPLLMNPRLHNRWIQLRIPANGALFSPEKGTNSQFVAHLPQT